MVIKYKNMEVSGLDYLKIIEKKAEIITNNLLKINKELKLSRQFIKIKIRNDRLKKPRKQNRYIKKYGNLELSPSGQLSISCMSIIFSLGVKAFSISEKKNILNELRELKKEQNIQNK